MGFLDFTLLDVIFFSGWRNLKKFNTALEPTVTCVSDKGCKISSAGINELLSMLFAV